jgi:RNA polymerase sigma-70 factor (ECF subfamily)
VDPSKDPGNATSLSLLDRVRANESAAWERFVNLYTPLLERWCHQWELQPADAANIRQEVFLAVTRHIGDYQRDKGSFRNWLWVITHNKVADFFRSEAGQAAPGGSDAWKKMQQVSFRDPDDTRSGSDDEDLALLYRRATELIARDFEETTWKAFVMVVIEDRTPAEAATELGISANAVYLAKGRVLSRLREEFGGLIDP